MRIRIYDKEKLKDTVLVFDDNPISKFVIGRNFKVKALGVHYSKGIRVYLGNIFHCLKKYKFTIERDLTYYLLTVITHEYLHSEIDKEIRNISLTQIQKYFRYYEGIEETILDEMMK